MYLFLTGTIASHLLLSGGCILGTTGLFHLGTNLWSIENSQRVAYLHEVALLHSDFQNTSRNLAGHTIFTNLHLTLNQLWVTSKGKESDQGHNGHYCRESYNCKQDVVMLRFCTHNIFYFFLFLFIHSAFP